MIMSDPGNEKITLEFDFDTRSNNKYDDWGDGTWVENYVTWETKKVGDWRSVTCSAKYMKEGSGFSTDVKIGNYIGDPVSQKGENPNAVSIPVATHTLFERTDDDQDYFQSYQKKQESVQHCSAIGTIYSATDGVEDDRDGNEFYWQMKNQGTITMWTGFRIWENAETTNWGRTAAVEVEFAITDFGHEPIPLPEPVETFKSGCGDEPCP